MPKFTPPDVPPPPATKPTEEKVTPILSPILKLLGSQKATVVLGAIAGATVLAALHEVTWQQWMLFVGPIVAVFLPSHAVQESAKAKADAGVQ